MAGFSALVTTPRAADDAARVAMAGRFSRANAVALVASQTLPNFSDPFSFRRTTLALLAICSFSGWLRSVSRTRLYSSGIGLYSSLKNLFRKS
jgi:Tfp pilus assembly protein FimT